MMVVAMSNRNNCRSPMNISASMLDCTARKMKVIAHPLRLKLLCSLSDGELSVQDLVALTDASQSSISQHLGQLRDKGILQDNRVANRVYYRVCDKKIFEVIGMLRDIYCINSVTSPSL
ncbi:MAG: hypothetical protein BMS9Abin26_1680 [Gammaproteobacteria bacterium]|nr:MAG: hypothetical protein BMS9Abin26_1680 [Gammaproteobacteria bacterium]